jgi:hypothetical protein
MPLTKVQAGLLEATGTPDATTFLRGDGAWSAPVAASLSTASGSAPSYSARAWVNFNGTGTVAIRGSANVTSITDNGIGNYTVNFTTAMQDANYAVSVAGGVLTNQPAYGTWDTPTASSVRVGNGGIFNVYAPVDGAFYAVVIFR